MALTIRANGNPITPASVNDYHDLLTGVMNDQPVFIKTTLGANTYPVLKLQSSGVQDLLRGYLSDGVTVACTIDASGNATFASLSVSGGSPTFAGMTSTGIIQIKPTSSDDSLQLYGLDRTYFATMGFGDASYSQGAGWYLYDNKNGGFVFKNGTATGIAFTGQVSAATVAATSAVYVGVVVSGSLSTVAYYGPGDCMYLVPPSAGAAAQGIAFQAWNGTATIDVFSIGGRFLSALAYIDNSGNYNGGTFNGLTIASNFIKSNAAFIGFKNSSNVKLAEFNSSGQLVVAAGNPSFVTTNATVGYSAGGAFDTFDVAEAYPTDGEYKRGEVLCPGHGHKLTRCTHDKCRAALVVSTGGAINIGGFYSDEEVDPTIVPMALVGRVLVDTTEDIPEFSADGQPTLVTANGRGGVRAMTPGENGFALGYMLSAQKDGKVGIIVRPMFCHA